MYRLLQLPSPQAGTHELAGFAEWMSWNSEVVSKQEIVACLGQIDDNDNNVGCDDDEDETSDLLDEVMNEIERRDLACGGGYPFRLERAGTLTCDAAV